MDGLGFDLGMVTRALCDHARRVRISLLPLLPPGLRRSRHVVLRDVVGDPGSHLTLHCSVERLVDVPEQVHSRAHPGCLQGLRERRSLTPSIFLHPELPEELRRRRAADGAGDGRGDVHPGPDVVLQRLTRRLVDVGASLEATEGGGVRDLVADELGLRQGGEVADDLNADPHVGGAEEVEAAERAAGAGRPLHEPCALLQRQSLQPHVVDSLDHILDHELLREEGGAIGVHPSYPNPLRVVPRDLQAQGRNVEAVRGAGGADAVLRGEERRHVVALHVLDHLLHTHLKFAPQPHVGVSEWQGAPDHALVVEDGLCEESTRVLELGEVDQVLERCLQPNLRRLLQLSPRLRQPLAPAALREGSRLHVC
mmetsp:Transcript_33873/g.106226  ORF Transcript_33873/g.106226 Transcript_33873/m.106226 type:complete len:368 (-) Transcript_33873:293-1396(-)